MNVRILLILLFIGNTTICKSQIDLYQKATGNDLSAYKHEDNFSEWKKLNFRTNKYIYYRAKICTTIINKKEGTVAHPISVIEVKVPDSVGESSITGSINIIGKKTLIVDGYLTTITDTTQQFFDVSKNDPIFSVEVVMDYSEISSAYVFIFSSIDELEKKNAPDSVKQKKGQIKKKINPTQRPAVIGDRG